MRAMHGPAIRRRAHQDGHGGYHRQAFTLVELVGVVFISFVIAAMLAPFFMTARRGCCSRQFKDVTQLRGVMQGLTLWAQSNNDQYPLPSVIDAGGATLPGPADEKDTTASIMSLLVYQGFFPMEMLVSPAEANPVIRPMEGYQFTFPAGAVDPANALWDPALNADFATATRAKTAHVSYANAIPRDGRWTMRGLANVPLVSNRGPQVAGVKAGTSRYAEPIVPTMSNTYLINGPRGTWEGTIAFDDNHVEYTNGFSGKKASGVPTYTNRFGLIRQDIIFYDEATDPLLGAPADNHFLGVFTTAGKERRGFTPIWD